MPIGTADSAVVRYPVMVRPSTLTSELSEISGVGLKTTQKLLTHFGSLAKIKEATVEDLQGVINRPQAEAVWKHFH